MKEMEYKFLVTKEKFYEIMKALKEKYPDAADMERVQINYYYDTDDNYLLNNNTTLRVRQIEDRITLELKESIVAANDFSTSNETIKPIDILTGDITLSEGRHAWIPFKMQGNLVTRRYSLKPSSSLSIDFDINCYFGFCDYEIEMEFTDNAKKATSILVKNLDLMQYKNRIGGKSRRFFARKSGTFKE